MSSRAAPAGKTMDSSKPAGVNGPRTGRAASTGAAARRCPRACPSICTHHRSGSMLCRIPQARKPIRSAMIRRRLSRRSAKVHNCRGRRAICAPNRSQTTTTGRSLGTDRDPFGKRATRKSIQRGRPAAEFLAAVGGCTSNDAPIDHSCGDSGGAAESIRTAEDHRVRADGQTCRLFGAGGRPASGGPSCGHYRDSVHRASGDSSRPRADDRPAGQGSGSRARTNGHAERLCAGIETIPPGHENVVDRRNGRCGNSKARRFRRWGR